MFWVVFWREWRERRCRAEREKRAERRKGWANDTVTMEVRQISVPVMCVPRMSWQVVVV